MGDLDPIIDNWYHNLESRARFEVVAVDERTQTVEIQHFDGEVEELDMETWNSLVLEFSEPPEDWSGPFDDLERRELGDGDLPAGRHDAPDPLDRLS